MIITRTPFRVSFLGGGSDYEAWYSKHGGAVLSCSINHYCYISARYRPAFFPEHSRVVWSEIELVNEHGEIRHPAIRAVLKHLDINAGVEIHHFTDLPARSGLGSSSAFTVGLLKALRAMRGEYPGAAELAQEAIHVEQNVMQETVGIQDQIQTAHGGLNFVRISPDGQYSLRAIVLPRDRLAEFQDHCLLFYTGIARTASTVAASQVQAIANGELDEELTAMTSYARRGADVLIDGELREFGLMLHQAWQLKRRLSPQVSNPAIDEMYQSAIEAGALGGKLLGAGAGGFLLLFADKSYHPPIRKALRAFLEVPFRIEFSGSQVIHSSQ